MKLFFWQNMVSPHQVPYIRELAQLGHDVTYITTEPMSPDRRELGWPELSLGTIPIILNPDTSTVAELISTSTPGSVHFIAGARGTPLGRLVAKECKRHCRRVGIVTEGPDTRGPGGIVRQVIYSLERLVIGRSFNFILAIGHQGVGWFTKRGYPPDIIFPFLYTVESSTTIQSVTNNVFEMIFVGRLVDLKGVDLLLTALSDLDGFRLTIIGDGPQEGRLKALALKLRLTDHVKFVGTLSNTDAQSSIAKADLLVLPSRKDGWGAVVNEALQAGTPVICSDVCGAASLLTNPWAGETFKSEQIDTIKEVLSRWISKGTVTPTQRKKIKSFTKRIEPLSVARYVDRVLAHVYFDAPRPVAPWLDLADKDT